MRSLHRHAKARLEQTPACLERLRGLLGRATFDTVLKGMAWYPEARGWVYRLHKSHGLPYKVVAGVISTLSPRVSWLRQTTGQVEAFLSNGRDVQTTQFMGMAEEVLRGNLAAISGPKITAFYRNLCGSDYAVTVDSICQRALLGPDSTSWRHGVRPQRYAWYTKCYRTVAAEFGLLPTEFQATVWLQAKKEGI